MGVQIQIALSKPDEDALRHWLAQRDPVLELPRLVSARDARKLASGEMTASEIGKGPDAENHLLFYPEAVSPLIRSLKPVVGAVGLFHFADHAGISVEWTHTSMRSDGHVAGRFYWKAGVPGPLADRTRKLFEAIRRHVKSRAEFVSTDPAPVFVGADLAAGIRRGTAKLVYPNGKPVPLKELR